MQITGVPSLTTSSSEIKAWHRGNTVDPWSLLRSEAWVVGRVRCRVAASVELSTLHPPDRLFLFDPFLFTDLQNLLVLDAKLPAKEVVSVQRSDDGIRFERLAEIGECQATELVVFIMIVECVRERCTEARLIRERLSAFHFAQRDGNDSR